MYAKIEQKAYNITSLLPFLAIASLYDPVIRIPGKGENFKSVLHRCKYAHKELPVRQYTRTFLDKFKNSKIN